MYKSLFLPTESLGVNEVCQGMEILDMEGGKVQWRILQRSWPALAFATAYERLSSILERGQSSSSKNALAMYATPPNQTTIPADPKYSNESERSLNTISSGDDEREHYTELFANDFVAASMTVFRLYVAETMSWLNPIYDFRLSPRLVISHPR